MPAVLLIGALLLAGRICLRLRRHRGLAQQRRADARRWEDDGGAVPASGEQQSL